MFKNIKKNLVISKKSSTFAADLKMLSVVYKIQQN